MTSRTRALTLAVAAAAGLALAGGTASAASDARPLDYYHLHSHHATHEACVAEGERYVAPDLPGEPGGADGYECRAAANGGWDLWLIFAT